MEVINNLDHESREKLKKQEFQVYRRKKLNQPLSTNLAASLTKPPPLDILLPRNPSKTERVDLKFDFEGALSIMNVTMLRKDLIISSKDQMDQWTPYHVTS
jgi:hypothetical protein